MARFALTIFASAFLLFQVQPLIARYILPWFGGAPSVWSTCMLFFQLVLLAGYSYAHALNHFFKEKMQAVIHMIVLVSACLMLPIVPSDSLRPTGEESPVFQVLLVLLATIGVPYFVVSTTGPLLQSWFSKSYPDRSPYRLFALSNFGSLVALLTYPFLFEPYFRQKTQAISWSTGFGIFALLCGWCALKMYTHIPGKVDHANQPKTDQPTTKYSNESKPTAIRILLWIGLSMVPSILLLATTNQVCQEVAVVPFLWVLPLALYLVTFIICFEAPYLYVRIVFYPLFAASIILAVVCLHLGVNAPMWLQAGGLISAFFFGSMVCHGELACNKPQPSYLTLYYLAISVGGALGGIFVVLIAPNIFQSYFELHVGYVLAICLTAIAFHSRADNKFFQFVDYRISACIGFAMVVGLSIPVIHHAATADELEDEEEVVYRVRDFWGILTVKTEYIGEEYEMRYLTNGRISHGNQYTTEDRQLRKTTYYCVGSGVGLAVERNPKRLKSEPMKIGVIGLGTGTMAAWGQTGDQIRFYEINPEVKKVAEEHFFYTKMAREKNGVDVDIILGDARIQMQRQLERDEKQEFDVLAVDAFSSDAIPRHLLTKECVQLYEKHMAKNGIIAIHISNRFLDLEGICYRIGTELGYQPMLIECDEPVDDWGYSNSWVLFTKNKEFRNDEYVNTTSFDHDWYRGKLEGFIEDRIGDTVDLEAKPDFDFKTFEKSLSKKIPAPEDEDIENTDRQSLSEYEDFKKRLQQWEKAERQFKVLWTDDFGSLWQVIRLEFDLKDSWDEVKEWWEEEKTDDDDTDSDE
jgi:heme/copper-type cytochrome/quinol oxidase subunit 4